MNILIAGATGMVGQRLSRALFELNHQVHLLGRDRAKMIQKFGPGFQVITWEEITKNKALPSSIDLVINLAGENIGEKKWSEKQKEKIVKSRVESTALLAQLCSERMTEQSQQTQKKVRLINASAIGIYEGKSHSTNLYDEGSEISKNPQTFLSQVAIAWEKALEPAEKSGVLVTKMRFAVVLSETGGALAKMLPAFKFGLGGALGSGDQLFSWISLNDLVRAIIFLINHPEITGAVNLVAPEVVTQKVFAKTLAKVLHRPCFLKIPEWILKIQFGEMAQELLLSGVGVKSSRLDQHGFVFEDKTLEVALKKIFIKNKS
jgi:uncharacterized protein (TIGR01777 family)